MKDIFSGSIFGNYIIVPCKLSSVFGLRAMKIVKAGQTSHQCLMSFLSNNMEASLQQSEF